MGIHDRSSNRGNNPNLGRELPTPVQQAPVVRPSSFDLSLPERQNLSVVGGTVSPERYTWTPQKQQQQAEPKPEPTHEAPPKERPMEPSQPRTPEPEPEPEQVPVEEQAPLSQAEKAGLAPSVQTATPIQQPAPATVAEDATVDSLLDVALNANALYQAAGPQTEAKTEVVLERGDDGVPADEAAPMPAHPEPAPQESPSGVVLSEAVLVDPTPVRIPAPTRYALGQARVVGQAIADQKAQASTSRKIAVAGTGVYDVVIADRFLQEDEISIGSELLHLSLSQPDSPLRELIPQFAPSADINRMVQDPAYAEEVFIKVFNTNDISRLVSKYPVSEAESAHSRIVRVHHGGQIHLAPQSFKVFNADADGDQAVVNLTEDEVANSLSAMDWLLGTDGEVKIDPDFVGMVPWGSQAEISNILTSVFDRAQIPTSSISALAAAVEKMSSGEKDKVSSGWQELVRWARRAAQQVYPGNKHNSDRMTSMILKAVYDINREISLARDWGVVESTYSGTQVPMPGNTNLTRAEDMRVGSMPANDLDYLSSLSLSASMSPGKNMPFRQKVSVGKYIKPDPRMIFGTNTWKNKFAWNENAAELVAKSVSGSIQFGDSRIGPATYMRDRVLKDMAIKGKLGAPSTYSDLRDFFKKFKHSYNLWAGVVNASNIVVMSDGTYKKGKLGAVTPIVSNDLIPQNEDFRSAFKKIYGDLTMGSLFGADCPPGFELTPLRLFIERGRYRQLDSKTIVSTNRAFINSLADLRTGEVRVFNEKLDQALKNNTGKLLGALESSKKATDPLVDAYTEALYLLGPDVFLHFDMVDVVGFVTSDVGMALIEAKSADAMGGILIEMVGRYRLDKIFKHQKKVRETTDPAAKARAAQKLAAVYAETASISDTWEAIITDIRNGGEAVAGVLYNRDMGRQKKQEALAKLVRETQGLTNFKLDYEVMYELMGNPSGLHSGTGQLSDFARADLLDNFKASSDLIDRSAKKTNEAAFNQVQALYAGEDKVDAEDKIRHLEQLADRGQFSIPTKQIADAIAQTLEIDFANTEKATQQAAANALFAATSYARNGGVYSDKLQADDFCLNKISLDDFRKNMRLIAKIMSDPDFSIEVYDGAEIVTVNRFSLVGSNSAEDAIKWLEANPRVYLALRNMSVYGSEDGESTFAAATASLRDSIESTPSLYEYVTTELADHPSFAGICLLKAGVEGHKKRTVIREIEIIIEETSRALSALASRKESSSELAQLAVVGAERRFGDHPSRAEILANLEQDIAGLIDCLRARNLNGGPWIISEVETSIFLSGELFDDSAIKGYFDVIQELSSAKTSLGTEVNGGESIKNGMLAILAGYTPEPCDAPAPGPMSVEEFEQKWDKYLRRKTTTGRYIDVDTYQLIIDEARLANPESPAVYIEDPAQCTHKAGCPCTRHVMGDNTTTLDGIDQKTMLGRLLGAWRALGSEALNLKIKKQGIDGTDSVSKRDIWNDPLKANLDQIKAITQEEGLPAARRALAEALYMKNMDMGYTMFTVDDFTNIAQMLIRQNPETGEVTILSLGQMNSMVAKHLSKYRDILPRMSQSEIAELALEAIAQPIGKLDISIIPHTIKIVGGMPTAPTVPELRQSSFDRNLMLMDELTKKSETYHDPKEIEEVSGWATGIAKSKHQYFTDEIVKNYTVIGWADSEEWRWVSTPGPRNTVIVDSSTDPAVLESVLVSAKKNGFNVHLLNPTEEAARIAARLGIYKDAQFGKTPHSPICFPMFDVLLNGKDTSDREGAYDTGEFFVFPDQIMRLAEDDHNVFGLTDAEFQPLGDLVDNVNPKYSGTFEPLVEEMFAVTRSENPDVPIALSTPGKVYIQGALINKTYKVQIDLGSYMHEGDSGLRELDEKIDKYVSRFGETDERGFLPDAAAGDIIGWVKGVVGGSREVWAPVIMYDLKRTGRKPKDFTIDSYGLDTVKGEFVAHWSQEKSILGETYKLFEGDRSTNKMMARDSLPATHTHRKLRNDAPLHAVVASASTSSRRMEDLKQDVMSTLFWEARNTDGGYNFAEVEGTLPNHPELKEGLLAGTATFAMWEEALKSEIDFVGVPHRNKAVLNQTITIMCKNALKYGVNPNTVLASHFNGEPSFRAFRWNVLFNSSEKFPDQLMQFFHFMKPTLCPDGREGDASATLFNNKLQMLVPLEDARGNIKWDWCYVFTGLHFLDSHFSGFDAKSISSPGQSLASDNALLLGGKPIPPQAMPNYVKWAMSSIPRDPASIVLASAETEDEIGEN